MSNSDFQSNNIDYPNNPDTVNYDYTLSNYNKPTEPGSNYEKTNYSITNFPKTDYNKFNADITNYNPVPETDYTSIDPNLPFKSPVNHSPFNIATCQSPDMLYQVPRDPQYKDVDKYMCFNNHHKLLEITKQSGKWSAEDLTYSNLHVKWNGSQCKITTSDICSRDKLSENCEATCFVSPNESVNIKYQNNIWRAPELESSAGACTMTAISEDTAQNSYCNCNNVLERKVLHTKPNNDKDKGGKFWCDTN
jgi:hypothetical protein